MVPQKKGGGGTPRPRSTQVGGREVQAGLARS